MEEMTEKKAIKIVLDYKAWRSSWEKWPDTSPPYEHWEYAGAEMFLSGLSQGRKEAEGLVAALVKIEEGYESCSRCGGDGRLWADGQKHYATFTGPTVPCGSCGGTGEISPNANEIAREALSAYRSKTGEGK